MAKKPMRCPFNDKMCVECPLYRGRHYYMCESEHYRGYIQPKDKVTTDTKLESIDFEKIKKSLEPWCATPNKVGENDLEPRIKLKIIDMETGKENICELDEAKTWNWDAPTIMRVVTGTQVSSWAKLAEITRYQEEKGATELVIYEAPRFMLIGGG